MAILKYKTRGMTTPQGKQRVYFCCHPDDFERCFENISKDILKKQNCAIWYVEDYNTTYDEQFFNDLKGMQLFVVPITTKFLFSESHAFSVEFKFAIENHIPVLPLMQESGLEEIFNKKCGDLQFLDKNVTDITAISYDEKLEKYLNSILVGDELAEKIRAAFDAYVFLSYRKKDRKYAQELMRLIHKNDFCRDIAIWYDEFLTPGEDFNNSIEEALGKSELFVLAVTPNLVNEINYVMTEEYPKAKELGKVILPAELVATNKKELSEKYENIPTPVDAYKDNELTEALLEAVKKIAIKENDGSPEHNFFIGLAYLSGVDVEVDQERALSLITASAEAGLLEAMTKLVEMYCNGTGVEQSYKTAIEWQKKIIEYHQRIYEKEPNEKNLESVFSSFIDCGDYYEEIFRLEDAKEKYISAKDLLEQSLNGFNSENITINRVKIANKLGHICYLNDQLEEAEKYYESVMKMGDTKVNKTESLVELLGAYVSLGDVYSGYNKYPKAEECYEIARKIITRFIEMMDETNLRYFLALINARLGNIYVAYGKYEYAVENYYKTSINMYSSIIAGDLSDNVTKRAIVDVYQRVGNVYEKFKKNYKIALDFYTKAFEYAIAVFEEEKNTFLARNDLALSCEKMGDAYTKMGKFDDAKKCYEKAIKIYSNLVEDTNTIRAIGDLSISYERLGDLYSENGFFKDAIEYHEISLKYKLLFAEKSNTIEARRNLHKSYLRIGINNTKLQEFKKAQENIQKALEISVSIVEETKTIRAKRDLFESYYWFGHNYNLNNELKNAKENYEKAIEIDDPFAEETNGIINKEDLVETYKELGGVYLRLKQYNKAIDCHKNVVKLTLLLIEETDGINLKNTLCKSYFILGFLQCHEDNIDDGIGFYKKAIETSRSTNDEVAFYKLIREILENCDVFGSYLCSKKDFENARKLLENALDIRALIVEKTNAIEDRTELSSRCIKLGAICEAEGNLEKAKEVYERALEIRKVIVKENDSEETRKALSVCYNKLSSVCETEGNWKLAKEFSDKAIDINLYGVDEQVSDDKTNSEKNDENLITKLKKRFLK